MALSVAFGENVFAGFGTTAGLAIGGWLALLSWAATAWALRGQTLSREGVRPILARAVTAGLAAGAAFFPGVLAGAAVATGSFELGALLFAGIAVPFAAMLGSVVALLLALLDVALFLVVARVVGRDAPK